MPYDMETFAKKGGILIPIISCVTTLRSRHAERSAASDPANIDEVTIATSQPRSAARQTSVSEVNTVIENPAPSYDSTIDEAPGPIVRFEAFSLPPSLDPSGPSPVYDPSAPRYDVPPPAFDNTEPPPPSYDEVMNRNDTNA